MKLIFLNIPIFSQMQRSVHESSGAVGGDVIPGAFPPVIGGIDKAKLEEYFLQYLPKKERKDTKSDPKKGTEIDPDNPMLISSKEPMKNVDDEPLPEGWTKSATKEGRIFYIDHVNKKTQWDHPLKDQLMNKDESSSSEIEQDNKTVDNEKRVNLLYSQMLMNRLENLSEIPSSKNDSESEEDNNKTKGQSNDNLNQGQNIQNNGGNFNNGNMQGQQINGNNMNNGQFNPQNLNNNQPSQEQYFQLNNGSSPQGQNFQNNGGDFNNGSMQGQQFNGSHYMDDGNMQDQQFNGNNMNNGQFNPQNLNNNQLVQEQQSNGKNEKKRFVDKKQFNPQELLKPKKCEQLPSQDGQFNPQDLLHSKPKLQKTKKKNSLIMNNVPDPTLVPQNGQNNFNLNGGQNNFNPIGENGQYNPNINQNFNGGQSDPTFVPQNGQNNFNLNGGQNNFNPIGDQLNPNNNNQVITDSKQKTYEQNNPFRHQNTQNGHTDQNYLNPNVGQDDFVNDKGSESEEPEYDPYPPPKVIPKRSTESNKNYPYFLPSDSEDEDQLIVENSDEDIGQKPRDSKRVISLRAPLKKKTSLIFPTIYNEYNDENESESIQKVNPYSIDILNEY